MDPITEMLGGYIERDRLGAAPSGTAAWQVVAVLRGLGLAGMFERAPLWRLCAIVCASLGQRVGTFALARHRRAIEDTIAHASNPACVAGCRETLTECDALDAEARALLAA